MLVRLMATSGLPVCQSLEPARRLHRRNVRIPHLLFTFPRESSVPRDKIYRLPSYLLHHEGRGENSLEDPIEGPPIFFFFFFWRILDSKIFLEHGEVCFYLEYILQKNFQYVVKCSMFGDGKFSNRFMDLSKYFEVFLYSCAIYIGCM